MIHLDPPAADEAPDPMTQTAVDEVEETLREALAEGASVADLAVMVVDAASPLGDRLAPFFADLPGTLEAGDSLASVMPRADLREIHENVADGELVRDLDALPARRLAVVHWRADGVSLYSATVVSPLN